MLSPQPFYDAFSIQMRNPPHSFVLADAAHIILSGNNLNAPVRLSCVIKHNQSPNSLSSSFASFSKHSPLDLFLASTRSGRPCFHILSPDPQHDDAPDAVAFLSSILPHLLDASF